MDKMLDLSPRQVCRLKARLQQLGAEGIIHGNTGCTPANAKPERLRARVISLYHDEFYDYNIAHFTETLAEEYGINLGLARSNTTSFSAATAENAAPSLVNRFSFHHHPPRCIFPATATPYGNTILALFFRPPATFLATPKA